MPRFSSLMTISALCVTPIFAQGPSPAATPAPQAVGSVDELRRDVDQLAQAPRPVQVPPAPTQPATPPRPPTPVAPQAPQAPQTPPVPPAPPRPEPVPSQSVRIEVTITDSLSAGAPTKKTVTMLVADNRNGRIRTTNFVRFSELAGSTPNQTPVTLNVDARPTLRTDARIQLDLTIEYMPEAPANSGGLRPSSISESLSALVQDGKPTLISQSADPVTDRKVTIEVTATIVK
jgi:hypothetical protein